MSIAIFTTLVVVYLNKTVEYSYVVMLFIKLAEFLILYILISRILHIKGYQIFMSELRLLLDKTFFRKNLHE